MLRMANCNAIEVVQHCREKIYGLRGIISVLQKL